MVIRLIYQKSYSEYVYKYSEENNIDPLLIFSIIKVESNFNKDAVSGSGAIGLMQLMEPTAKEIEIELNEDLDLPEGLYDSEVNIKIGIKYFSKLMKKYGDNYLLAVAAYNAGIGTVDKWIIDGVLEADGSNIENIPYKETNNYVRKIVRDFEMYKKLYN